MAFLMTWLSTYVRNLAVFILFMTFAGMIVPSGKYKGYVNLISGFVLMFLLVSPLVSLLAMEGLMQDQGLPVFQEVVVPHHDLPQQLAHNALQTQWVSTVESHVWEMIEAHGLVPVDVTAHVQLVDAETVVLNQLMLQVALPPEAETVLTPSEPQDGLGIVPVIIDRVMVTGRVAPIVTFTDERVDALRDALVQFYRMDASHIHVNIQNEQEHPASQ